MRHTHLLFTLLALLALGAPNAEAQTCAPLPAGAVGWWPLDSVEDGLTEDVLGDRTGHWVGTSSRAVGLVDGAAHFDGASYVAVADSDRFSPLSGELTVELWVQFTAPPSGNAGHPGEVLVSHDLGPFNVDKWFVAAYAGHLEVVAGRSEDSASSFAPNIGFVPDVGRWYHVAFRKVGPTYDLFIDGVLAGSGSGVDPLADIDAPLTFGQALEPFRGNLDGRLDEITLYRRGLADHEIFAIAQAGSAGKCRPDTGPSLDANVPAQLQLGRALTIHPTPTGVRAPLTWRVRRGALPDGLRLTATGTISGTPEALGASELSIEVSDVDGRTATATVTTVVVLSAPEPEVHVTKFGTTPVPGRVVDYFVLIENNSTERIAHSRGFELLTPPETFAYVHATPTPTATSASALYWNLDPIEPGGVGLVTYSVRIQPDVQRGDPILGPFRHWKSSCAAYNSASRTLKFRARLPCADQALLIGCNFFCNRAHQFCGGCPRTGLAGGLGLHYCVRDAMTCADCLANATKNCDPRDTVPDDYTTDDRDAVRPIDPNEKVSSPELFVPRDRRIVYAIHYENVGDVEARDVFLRDVLDPALDPATIEFFTEQGEYEPTTRTLSWDLIDRNLPAGETDHVAFSILPRSNVTDGTVIENSATIQFEIFEVIQTGTVTKIIDETRPTCEVAPLPEVTETATITLVLTATDAVGRIEGISLFGARDDGPFELLHDGPELDTFEFAGQDGHDYAFLCVARDTAGNRETDSLDVEAATQIVLPTEPRDGGTAAPRDAGHRDASTRDAGRTPDGSTDDDSPDETSGCACASDRNERSDSLPTWWPLIGLVVAIRRVRRSDQ